MIAMLLAALICLAPLQASSQSFVLVPPAQALPRPERGPAPGGLRYAIVDGELRRGKGDELAPIPCARPENSGPGPGTARAFVHHPAGTTWLAADNGLFCTSPDVDVLDR